MKYEPTVDRKRMIATVREVYDLPAERLSFVPVGYAAVCYVLHCAGGGCYFLKYWPDTDAGRAVAARLDFVLPLTRALYDRNLVPRLPYPLTTREGALLCHLDGRPLAIFPFVSGMPAPEILSLEHLDEFARTVAAIHRATAAVPDLLPPRERFALDFEPDLRRAIEVAARATDRSRPGLRAVRDLILPRRDEVTRELARLHALQARVKKLPGPFVLCHTDLGGDNLHIDEQGRISVLDWDDVALAPPEHDLQAGLGPHFDRFLAVYVAAGGTRTSTSIILPSPCCDISSAT